jgi:purine-binding chemotaxis protein CheW
MTAPSTDGRRILRERARALARPVVSAATSPTIEVIEFRVARERYAVETRHVREIHPLRDLTPLPGLPAFVLGIVNVRGRVVPVFDIRRLFELPERGLDDRHHVVLVAGAGLEFGLLADAIDGVRPLALDELQPAPATFTGIRSEYLKGVAAHGLALLDLERMFADPGIVVQQDGDAWNQGEGP